MYFWRKSFYMNKIILTFFISTTIFAQTDTEVFLYAIVNNNGKMTLKNGKNISNNVGYDSQPHFYSDSIILFSSTRNKQTDIAQYNSKSGTVTFLNNTANGGEYSPQRIPNSKDVSAVRLDSDGLQRFYKYDYNTGESTKLIKDLKVAYPMWYKENTVVSVVIVRDDLDLMVHDLRYKQHLTIQKKAGRSLHRIPNTNLVSYISKATEKWEVRSLDPNTGTTKKIINTPSKKEDICWLPNGTLLLANENVLLKFNPKTDTNWSIFYEFSKEKHKNISRILVNKKGTKLALVSN